MKRCLSYILCKYMRYSLNETTSDVADEIILCQITCNRGPCTNDVSLIFGIFDPPPPPVRIYSIEITQPPFLSTEIG